MKMLILVFTFAITANLNIQFDISHNNEIEIVCNPGIQTSHYIGFQSLVDSTSC